ncbi:MAG TPA: hypothetical protein VKB69_07100, partial [Micromonosporaceae bacterium]|nr:hypothetical protein [Micromonosporaceae bacterium]
MTDLHGRYERLLFAYPREYRRRRGAEIAATYAEMATEGQRWPRGRDAASLLRHGLRARLGRPRSRLVVPATVVAMLVGGLCAAAAGALVGWGGSTGLSNRQMAEAGRIGPVPMFGQAPMGAFSPEESRAGTPAWSAGYLSTVVSGTQTMVQLSGPVVVFGVQPAVPQSRVVRELVDRERARLAETGWTVTSETVTGTDTTMTVRKGDLAAELRTYSTAP